MSAAEAARTRTGAATLADTGTAAGRLRLPGLVAGTSLVTGLIVLPNVDLRRAIAGWSPVLYASQRADAASWEADWPAGISGYAMSLPMEVFRWVEASGLVSASSLLPVLVVGQFLVLGLGLFALARAMFRDPRAAAFAALVALCAPLAGMNLANFGYGLSGHNPYLYYHLGTGLAILGMAAFLEGRWWVSAVALGLALETHLTIALYALAFVGAGIVAAPRRILRGEALAAGFLLALPLVRVAWKAWSLSGGAGRGLGEEAWALQVRIFSYHWFPIGMDYLGARSGKLLLPILTLAVAAFSISWSRGHRDWKPRQLVAAGLGATLLLSAAGVVLSEASTNPTLIQLALHRASFIVSLIGLLYLAYGLHRWALCAPVWVLPVVAFCTVCLVFGRPGFPAVAVFGLTAVLAWRRERRSAPAVVAGLLALGFLAWNQTGGDPAFEVLLGGLEIGSASPELCWSAGLLLGACWLLARWWTTPPWRAAPLVGAALVAFAFHGVKEHRWREKHGEEARAVMDVGRWLADHTAPDAVFMANPARSLGWREYSHRPYFGSLPEWGQGPLVYAVSPGAVEAGRERAAAFGIHLASITRDDLEASSRTVHAQRLQRILDERFRRLDAEALRGIARRFGVDHLVVEHDRWDRGALEGLPLRHRNARFSVYELR